MMRDTDVSLVLIKNAFAELGTETNLIINTMANTIKSWLPPTHTIFIVFIVIIIVMGILTVMTILITCRQPQIKIDVRSESNENEQVRRKVLRGGNFM